MSGPITRVFTITIVERVEYGREATAADLAYQLWVGPLGAEYDSEQALCEHIESLTPDQVLELVREDESIREWLERHSDVTDVDWDIRTRIEAS